MLVQPHTSRESDVDCVYRWNAANRGRLSHLAVHLHSGCQGDGELEQHEAADLFAPDDGFGRQAGRQQALFLLSDPCKLNASRKLTQDRGNQKKAEEKKVVVVQLVREVKDLLV